MNKRIIGSLIVSTIIVTNSFGVGMTSPEFIAAQTGMDAKNWGIETTFQEALSELSLQNTIMSGQVGLNGNKAYDAAMGKTSELGGAYGQDIANVMDSCFNLELPSFSKGLGLDGLSFCGIGDVSKMMSNAIKGKTDTVQTKNEDKLNEKKKLPKGEKVQPKGNGSKTNCNSAIDSKCKAKSKAIIQKEIAVGVGPGGESTTITVKNIAKDIYFATKDGITEDDDGKKLICSNSELVDGTTESYTCRKDIVQDIGKYEETNTSLLNSTSTLIDASERDVRTNMINSNEKLAEATTDRINKSREIRDEYNIRYNPNTLVVKDVEKMGKESFYERNKETLNQDPTLYIVPQLKDNKFSIGKFGLDNYKEAMKEFGKLKIEDVDGNVLETSDQIERNIDRLGGVTPFTSSLYGYDASLSVIAKNIYDGTSEKSGEQGTIGREFALVNGLKGVMYQNVLINQQLENMNRANYNIRVKEFDKLSQDNDNLNNKIEQMQNQNAMIIELLKSIDQSLNKLANK